LDKIYGLNLVSAKVIQENLFTPVGSLIFLAKFVHIERWRPTTSTSHFNLVHNFSFGYAAELPYTVQLHSLSTAMISKV
jgi:hypothetical protein